MSNLPAPDNPTCVAVICGADAVPVGGGVFLSIDDRLYVLTCAHVVNSAIGQDRTRTEFPDKTLVVRAWPPDTALAMFATVADNGWHPIAKNGKADLALLRIAHGSAPVAPVRLFEHAAGRTFQCIGFPAGYKRIGQHVAGRMLGHHGPSGEWFQLDGMSETGHRIREGFSGTPVWDVESRSVVGIVVAEDKLIPSAKSGAMIPMSVVGRYLPQLKPVIGPPAQLESRLAGLIVQRPLAKAIPRVREVDHALAGVTITQYDLQPAGSPYVERDIDADGSVLNALVGHTGLLLIGPPKSGKSRCALHVAKTHFGEAAFIRPKSRAAIDQLLAADVAEAIGEEVIIWLDDVQQFLPTHSHDGLTTGFLDSIVANKPKWRVVATLRDDEFYRLNRASEEGKDSAAVLRSPMLKHVWLSERLSPRELVEAQLKFPDETFSGGVGIGERLVAGPELVAKLNSGQNKAGWALAQSAVDWARTGVETPIPYESIKELARIYLAERFPLVEVDEQDWDRALQWCKEPVWSHVSLMAPIPTPFGIRFRPFDYVVREVEAAKSASPVPVAAWKLATEHADGPELANVIQSAHRRADWFGLVISAGRGQKEFVQDVSRTYCAFLVGFAHSQLGEYAAAVEPLLMAATKGQPVDAAHAWGQLGSVFLKLGERAKARTAYERAIESHHDHTVTDARFGLGELEELEQRYDQAIAIYLQLAETTDGTGRRAWIRIAALHEKQGRQLDAAEALKQAAATDSDPKEAARHLLAAGHKYRLAGHVPQATAAYQQVAKDADGQVAGEAAFFEGLVSSDSESQTQAYRQAIASGSPWSDAAAVNLAAILPETAERTELLERAAAGHDQHAAALALLALSELRLKNNQHSEAVSMVARAKGMFGPQPSGMDAYFLGEATKSLGDLKAAHDAFRTAARTLGDDLIAADKAQFALAQTAALQGDQDAAKSILTSLLSSTNDEVQSRAKLELAEIYQREGDNQRIVELLSSATAAVPATGVQIRRALSRALANLGSLEDSFETLQPDLHSEDPVVRAHANEWMGILYGERGMWNEAAKCYQVVLDGEHGHSVAHAGFEVGWLIEDHPEVLAGVSHRKALAENAYRQSIEIKHDPWSGLAAWRLSFGLDKTDRTQEAIDILLQVGNAYSENVMYHINSQLGALTLKQNKRNRALGYFEQSLSFAQKYNDPEFIGKAARNVATLADAKEEATLKEHALDVAMRHGSPDQALEAGAELAAWHMSRGNDPAAREAIESVIALDGNRTTKAWLLFATLLERQGQWDSAIAALRQAQKSDDRSIADAAEVELANLQWVTEQKTDALEETLARASADPDAPTQDVAALAWFYMAQVQLSRDDVEGAKEALLNAKRVGSHDVAHEATLQLAQVLAVDSPDEAIEECQELIKSNTPCKHVWSAAILAADLIEPYNDERRRPLLKLAAQSAIPEIAERGKLNLALWEVKDGHWKQAVSLLRDIIKLKVTDEYTNEARALLGYSLLNMDQTSEAENLLLAEVKNQTVWIRDLVTYSLGRLYVAQEKIDQAMPYLRLAVDSDSADIATPTRVLLAKARRLKGEVTSARAIYETLLSSSDEEIRREAAEAIAELDSTEL